MRKAISRKTTTDAVAPMPTRLPALKLMLLLFATPRSTTVKTLNDAKLANRLRASSLRLADGQPSYNASVDRNSWSQTFL
jgi:hypothetical protein